MMLKAVPPWMLPIVTTAESSGEISRETTDWSASTTRAAARIGSAASCGEAPWPPRPSMSMVKLSTAAISAPRLTPILPTGNGLQRCSPKAAVTPSSAPWSVQACAPPRPSSAGWWRKRNAPAGGRRTSRSATARPIAMCPSWPQACIRPGDSEAYGAPLASSSGSASMSARSRIRRARCAPVSAQRPVPATPVRGDRDISRIRPATRSPVRRSSYAISGWR